MYKKHLYFKLLEKSWASTLKYGEEGKLSYFIMIIIITFGHSFEIAKG